MEAVLKARIDFHKALFNLQSGLERLDPKASATITGRKSGFTFKYAKLHEVWDHLKAAIVEHEFTVMQFGSIVDGKPALRTLVTHVPGGHQEQGDMFMATTDDMRGVAGSVTTARRISICAAFGIMTTDEPDAAATDTNQGGESGGWANDAKKQRAMEKAINGFTTLDQLGDWWNDNRENVASLNPESVTEVKALVGARHKELEAAPAAPAAKPKPTPKPAPAPTPKPKAKAVAPKPKAAAPKPKAEPKPQADEPLPPPEDDFGGAFE